MISRARPHQLVVVEPTAVPKHQPVIGPTLRESDTTSRCLGAKGLDTNSSPAPGDVANSANTSPQVGRPGGGRRHVTKRHVKKTRQGCDRQVLKTHGIWMLSVSEEVLVLTSWVLQQNNTEETLNIMYH